MLKWWQNNWIKINLKYLKNLKNLKFSRNARVPKKDQIFRGGAERNRTPKSSWRRKRSKGRKETFTDWQNPKEIPVFMLLVMQC